MPTGTYKLQSVARPGQFISLLDNEVVAHSDKSGVVIEWHAAFEKDEDNLASFRAVRPGEIYSRYISFDSETGSLKVSKEPWFFAVKPGVRLPSYFSIEVVGIQKVLTLTSWAEGAPIELQHNTDATQQLWMFDAAGSAE